MAGHKGILCLDLASTTGWAYVSAPDQRPVYGSFHIPAKFYSRPEIYLRFMKHINDLLTLHKPKTVGIEAPIIARLGDINGPRKLLGFTAFAESLAWRHGVRDIQDMHIQTVKKYWTGTAHAKKEDMMFEAKRRGFNPKDDNEADALALLHVMASKVWGVEL